MNGKTTNYEELISYFTRAYQHSEEESMKKLFQSFIKSWVDCIRKRDGKEDNIYEEMLSKVDLSLKSLEVEKKDEKPLEELPMNEEKSSEISNNFENETSNTGNAVEESSRVGSIENGESTFTDVTGDITEPNGNDNIENELTDEQKKLDKYLQEHIFNDSKIKEEYEELKEKLGIDLENPNDVLIQTWVNNYKEFISNYDLDKDIMLDNMEKLFVDIYGKEEWFNFAKDIYTNENIVKKEETKSNEGPSLDDFEEKKESDNVDTSNVSTKTEMSENLDGNNKGVVPSEGISSDVSPEDEKSDKKEDTTPNVSDESKKTDEIDKGKSGTEKEIPEDALKIVSMEKPVGKVQLGELAVKYLVPIALMAVSNSLIPLGLIWIAVAKFGTPVWNFIEEKWYNNISVERFLKEYDLISKKAGEKGFVLIDKKTGKMITKADVGKERYDEIKQELIKIGAMDSSLFERFEKVPVLSWGLKCAKGLIEKTKDLVSSRKEYKNMCKVKEQLMKNATSSEEYYEYKNAKVVYKNNKFCLVDKNGNIINENIVNKVQAEENVVEEVESKGRSK